ncbi:MAG: HU family DNA-binding protein [Candidatus Berkiellales bacterium]
MSNVPVNKAEIIEYIAEHADISKASATRALNAVIEKITKGLINRQMVTLLGFGSFQVKPRAARIGRNPKTGEPLNIEAANVPSFKAGKALKDAVNSGSIVAEDA